MVDKIETSQCVSEDVILLKILALIWFEFLNIENILSIRILKG